MNNTHNSSGPRSNLYSASKFTNWSKFDPYSLEADATYKKFDKRISRNPDTPKVIILPVAESFWQPCGEIQIRNKLNEIPKEHIQGLRAVFMLAGTKKQKTSYYCDAACYGMYWRSCIFLYALLEDTVLDKEKTSLFYLRDTLIHEIGHHVDQRPNTNQRQQEAFANWFALQHGGKV